MVFKDSIHSFGKLQINLSRLALSVATNLHGYNAASSRYRVMG